MIKAILSVNQYGSANYNANLNNLKKVAFLGRPISLVQAEESAKPLRELIAKIVGKAELPFSKRSLTADATIKHIIGDGQGMVDIPVPEVHTAVTKIIDANNILVPDAADLAANTADALSTKAALAGVLGGTSHAFDAVTGGLDAAATKASVVDAVATGADALATKSSIVDAAHTGIGLMASKTDAVDLVHKVIEGIANIVDKIF